MADLSNLKTLVTTYRGVREARLTIEKELKSVVDQEKKLQEEILNLLEANSVSSVSGDGFQVRATPRAYVNVTDWPGLYKHIQETGEFDLLHRRPSVMALVERAQDGRPVPGCEIGHYKTVVVSDAKRSK